MKKRKGEEEKEGKKKIKSEPSLKGNKEKKKTLTITSNFKKKIDTSSFQKNQNKKSFSISNDKKNTFRPKNTGGSKILSKANTADPRNKKFNRKFIEQQATKAFIKKKDDKPTGKSKLKLKTPIDKRDFKLTVSRALNVEEIEIKQRSLAAVKRARLKDKKNWLSV